IFRQVLPPGPHRSGELPRSQVGALRVAANEYREPHFGQAREQFSVPKGEALLARREIPALRLARIAESHGDDGYAFRVVENVVREAEPLPQPSSARVVPGNTRIVRLDSRGLADHEETRRPRRLEDGFG